MTKELRIYPLLSFLVSPTKRLNNLSSILNFRVPVECLRCGIPQIYHKHLNQHIAVHKERGIKGHPSPILLLPPRQFIYIPRKLTSFFIHSIPSTPTSYLPPKQVKPLNFICFHCLLQAPITSHWK